MKMLDRYIIRNFLLSAMMWFLVLMALRVMADLFINLDEFVEGERQWSMMISNVVTYYGYQSLTYFAQLGGVIIVAAAAFSLAMMNHTNELTAILSSGVSLYRVIWPVVLCAMLMGGLIILDQELVIPKVADKLVRSRDDVPGAESFQVRLMPDSNGTVWYAKSFHPDDSRMDQPVIFVRDENMRQLGSIFGQSARPVRLDGQSGWLVTDASLTPTGAESGIWLHTPDSKRIYTSLEPNRLIRVQANPDGAQADFQARGEDPVQGLRIRAKFFEPAPQGQVGAVLAEPRFAFTAPTGQPLGTFIARRATWRVDLTGQGYWQLESAAMFFPSDLTKTDLVLRQSSGWMEYMSSTQLSQLLKLQWVPNPNLARLIKHTRITDPISNLVMLLLALPFILSRERNIKSSAGLCVAMVGVYYAFVYFCRFLGIAPGLAAWLPILLFGPIAVVMVDSVKT